MQENVRWGGHHHHLQCHHHHFHLHLTPKPSSCRVDKVLQKVSHTISSRCIACRFHHCLRSQQLNLLQLRVTSTLLTFDQHQYLQYQHVELLLSISSSSSHRAGMRPDLVLDDYQINARWHQNFYLSCNLFLCKVQKGSAAQGGGEEEPDGGQGASHM